MASPELRVLFCQRFGCPSSEYEERAFRECLYLHARLLAPLLRWCTPELFSEDFKFIRYLGEATNAREVKANAADFQDANLAHRSFWRTRLKIRVSGRKAGRLAQRLLAGSK